MLAIKYTAADLLKATGNSIPGLRLATHSVGEQGCSPVAWAKQGIRQTGSFFPMPHALSPMPKNSTKQVAWSFLSVLLHWGMTPSTTNYAKAF
ncbi:MAG: hypothetical protein V7L20_11405 [Nostoc sp.]|uniref:hypothetical protein n=1 Tax=Nostoc sp. TaxID=1180 RepID=UPI002FF46D01